MNNYDLLISKLDAFIRKYYANKLLKGVLVFTTSLLLFVLTVTVSEYYFYMPVWLRTVIAILFVASALAALAVWIVVPLSKMARLGKTISHELAAVIIGQHFEDVSDKTAEHTSAQKECRCPHKQRTYRSQYRPEGEAIGSGTYHIGNRLF